MSSSLGGGCPLLGDSRPSNCCRMGASTRVTRAGYARVSEGGLTLITACPSLSTGYVGETSRFPDVRGDSYAYNAIAVSVERGTMSADRTTGRFRPEDRVSGVELSPFWTCTAINSLTNVTDDLG